MSSLAITCLCPNPIGRDTMDLSQLHAEQLVLRNTASFPIRTGMYYVLHRAYQQSTSQWAPELVCVLPDCELQPGERLVVHSGRSPALEGLLIPRTVGTQHYYSGRNHYVWNNKWADEAMLMHAERGLVDRLAYERTPIEGEVICRK